MNSLPTVASFLLISEASHFKPIEIVCNRPLV